mgnify:CR=1 FL=1
MSKPTPGTRAYYRTLATYDIADSCRRLRLPCAAAIALTASTPAEWRDVAAELGAVAVGADREHERAAVRRAATVMSADQVSTAIGHLARLRGVEVSEWEADVVEAMRVESVMAVAS